MPVIGALVIITVVLVFLYLIIRPLVLLSVVAIFAIAVYSYLHSIPAFRECPLNILDYTFSWAAIIPIIISLLALHFIKG